MVQFGDAGEGAPWPSPKRPVTGIGKKTEVAILEPAAVKERASMHSNIQDKITTAPQKERLAGDQLREAVEFAVKKLSENVFAALKESNTPSILIYSIVKSVEPIIQAALVTRSSVEDLTKDIWPAQFTLFGRYLEDGSFKDRSVTDAVTHILTHCIRLGRISLRDSSFSLTRFRYSKNTYIHKNGFSVRSVKSYARGSSPASFSNFSLLCPLNS